MCIYYLYYPPIYACVSQVVSFPQLSHQNPVYASPLTHTRNMPRPSHSSLFYHPKNIGRVQKIKLILCSFLHYLVTSPFLGPNILLSTLFSNTLSTRPSLNVRKNYSVVYLNF